MNNTFKSSINNLLNLFIKVKITKKIKVNFLFLLLSSITYCQSIESKFPSIVSSDSINGFWKVVDKGYVINFTEDNDIFYNVNTAGCSIQNDNFNIEERFGLTLTQINPNELIGTSDLLDLDIKFTKLNKAPKCITEHISSTKDAKINFDHFWNIFNDYYAFFKTKNIDWSQYKSLRNEITDDNLYDKIEKLAYLLEDGHVSIIDKKNDIKIRSGALKSLKILNTNLSRKLTIETRKDYEALEDKKAKTIIKKYLRGNFEIDDNQNIGWGLINKNVGYINIINMQGYGGNLNNELKTLNKVLDKMMSQIKTSGISKLIIDIRFNEGGFDTVALDIASRFMDKERTSYSKKTRLGNSFTEDTSLNVMPKGNFQFTGDIVLLTSPVTISAAEVFTLCMKDLPYVTIVGENTAGAFSTILTHILPNGATVKLSNEIYNDSQGMVFESIGIGPENQENRIPFLSTLDFKKRKDSGIDRALEVLNH